LGAYREGSNGLGGVPTGDIEARFTVNPFTPVGHGDIRGFADGSRFLLESAIRIASVVLERGLDEDATTAFLKRLELGIPIAALPLTGLGIDLTRGELLSLWRAGIGTRESAAALSKPELEAIMGARGDALHRLVSVALSAGD